MTTNPRPSPLLDASGNPSLVSAGELIESAWGNSVAGRVVLRFPNNAAMGAVSPANGTLAVTTDRNVVWYRDGGFWKPTGLGNRIAFRLTGGATGQAMSPNVDVTALWTTEESDPFNLVSAGIFTVPSDWAGRWTFEWSVNWPSGGGARRAYLSAGGGHFGKTSTETVTGTFPIDMAGSASTLLPGGSQVSVQMYHTHSAAIAACNGSANHYFQGYYSGPY